MKRFDIFFPCINYIPGKLLLSEAKLRRPFQGFALFNLTCLPYNYRFVKHSRLPFLIT